MGGDRVRQRLWQDPVVTPSIGHTILTTALHPVACRQVVDALNSQKKQGSDDRREWTLRLTEIQDCVESEERGDDWDHLRHQELFTKSLVICRRPGCMGLR
jgi:hypothetical protein